MGAFFLVRNPTKDIKKGKREESQLSKPGKKSDKEGGEPQVEMAKESDTYEDRKGKKRIIKPVKTPSGINFRPRGFRSRLFRNIIN